MTVYFTQVTNSPNVGNTAAIQNLFGFNPWLSNNMSGVVSPLLVSRSLDEFNASVPACHSRFIRAAQWYTGGDSSYSSAAQRLVIAIAGSVNTDYLATAVGTASISLLPSGGLTNAAGTSQVASSAGSTISGSWGPFSQPTFHSPVCV